MSIKTFFDQYNTAKPKVVRPYVIAEAGVNHECSMDLARQLIEEAKEGGADAIKFQTYKAGTIASKDSPSYWDRTKEPTASQYELFKKYDKFWKDEFTLLKEHCEKVGIEFLSTPFDVESAFFLNELMNCYKISSSDITNLPFIEVMCKFDKPIILSTGASYLWEVERAVETIKSYGNPMCLMHCILNYPTLDENANLGMILHLKEKYPNLIPGYSDHTLPHDMEVSVIATLLGTAIIEKHFTHDKTLQGNDHYHAMDKEDLKHFRQRIDRVFNLLGSMIKAPLPTEDISRQNARRSLVVAADIAKNTTITYDHLTWKRPASGISPSEIDAVMGKKVIKDLEKDTVLKWDMLI